jgi:hypothetical protein
MGINLGAILSNMLRRIRKENSIREMMRRW